MPSAHQSKAYGLTFWSAYVANLLVATSHALLYRYADFVDVLGGTEFHLGWIVGIGMTGSLVMRLILGTGIDRCGPRRIWLWSLMVLVASLLGHLLITSHTGPAIYVLRVLWCSAIAGIFGSSTAFIATGLPLGRMAEMVGMLGTSGFLGMMVGTHLGDLLFGAGATQRPSVDHMFLAAAAFALVAMGFAWFATRVEAGPVHRHAAPLLPLLRRYQPGAVLLMGVASGIGLGLPATFLRPYGLEIGVPHIGLFFTAYATAAIVSRVMTRRWFDRFALERLVLLGTAGLVGSTLLFLVVRQAWQLLIPGVGFGAAHALLFPAIVACVARSFPNRHRGLATILAMATWDVGLLIGSPIAGMVVHYAGAAGLPGYPSMFVAMAGLMGLMGWGFAQRSARPASSSAARPAAHTARPAAVASGGPAPHPHAARGRVAAAGKSAHRG